MVDAEQKAATPPKFLFTCESTYYAESFIQSYTKSYVVYRGAG